MEKFKQWYTKNQTKIAWFLIGFLLCSGLSELARGEYLNGAISLGLAWANYYLSR